MKKKQIIIIIALVLLLALAYWYSHRSTNSDLKNDQSTPPTPPAGTKPATGGNDAFPLQRGSVGNNVTYVQRAINKINPQASLVVDGNFGKDTYEALITYVGTKYYPVSATNFTEILRISNTK